MASVWEASRVSSLQAEAKSNYELRDSSKADRKSKKPKALRPGNDRLSVDLDYNTDCRVGRSSLYEDQVAKHVVK